jgi:cation:H+ antiporter
VLTDLTLTGSVIAFAVSAVVLVVVGVRFTKLVDALADRTGIGEALAGAVLVGAVTSLPGLVTSVVGAADGDASFAVSNSLGGIAAQTTFLALADLTYRRANLEHAAASLPNLLQSLGLITLVALVFVASAGPEVTVLGVHPVTLLLPLVYVYWLRLTRDVATRPMWEALLTPETREDVPDDDGADQRPLAVMWAEFAVLAGVVAGTASSWGGPGCRWPGPPACRRASWARCSPRSSRRYPNS